jgi:hypothetical protein
MHTPANTGAGLLTRSVWMEFVVFIKGFLLEVIVI